MSGTNTNCTKEGSDSKRDGSSTAGPVTDPKTEEDKASSTDDTGKPTSTTETIPVNTETTGTPVVPKTCLLKPAYSDWLEKFRVWAKTKITPTKTTSILITILLMIIGCILIPIISYFFNNTPSKHSNTKMCDMNQAENRDFNKFYGIDGPMNHFTVSTPEACTSGIVYKSLLPQAVLQADNSASSFIVMGKSGTGKTLLRCAYVNILQPNRCFKILLLNKHLSEYLQRFVSEISTDGRNCESENCFIDWSKTEFAQLLLSMLATQFVDEYKKDEFDLSNLSVNERVKVIKILCYYYNGQGVRNLEKFINFFLEKSDGSMYYTSAVQSQILERDVYQDKPLLTYFKKDLKKLIVLEKDDQKLELLLAVVEGEGFQSEAMEATMFENVFKHLTYFAVFIKTHLNKSVVFIIDGLDENRYLSQNNVVKKESLELFLRSSVSAEIQSTVMAQNFYLSLFYPEIDGIDIEDMITRPDKFPTYRIEWNTRSLMHYADYVLQEMNKRASTIGCRPLPDFKTLLNYTNHQSADIINRISTPRALHSFMQKLIIEMNDYANDSEKPFIATMENVVNAFNKSTETSNKYHST